MGESAAATQPAKTGVEWGKEEGLPWEQQANANPVPTPSAVKNKNWPFFWPVVRHVISEIPESSRSLVARSYTLWRLTTASYLLNLICSLAMFLVQAEGHRSVAGPIFATLYLIVMPVLGFFGWHHVLYRACARDFSFLFLVFFVTFSLQLLFFVFLGLGMFNGGGR